ncbi:MAG: hypothetical protein AAB592_03495 [Patescibacteria group bacterium]
MGPDRDNVIFLLGAPGAGKTTLCKNLERTGRFAALSRDEVEAEESALYLEMQSAFDAVGDDLSWVTVEPLVREYGDRLRAAIDKGVGFIEEMEGFDAGENPLRDALKALTSIQDSMMFVATCVSMNVVRLISAVTSEAEVLRRVKEYPGSAVPLVVDNPALEDPDIRHALPRVLIENNIKPTLVIMQATRERLRACAHARANGTAGDEGSVIARPTLDRTLEDIDGNGHIYYPYELWSRVLVLKPKEARHADWVSSRLSRERFEMVTEPIPWIVD